jgi:signal transduction histidine kinase/HAMP domain-containing protein
MIIKRFLIIALTGIVLSFSLLLYIIAKKETALVEEANDATSRLYSESVTTALTHAMSSGAPETAKRIITELNSKGSLKISVFRDNGSLAFGAGGFTIPPSLLASGKEVRITKGNASIFLDPVPNEQVCHSCHVGQGPILGLVAIQMPLQASGLRIARGGRNFIVFGIMLFFSAAGAVFLATKKMLLDPLAEIHLGVEAIKRGDLTRRISLHRSDELGALANTLDQMAEHVEKSHIGMEEAIRRKTTELRVVAELSTGVFRQDDPLEAMIGRFLDAITGDMGFGYASLCLIDKETGMLSREFMRGLDEGFCAAKLPLAGDHPFTRAAREAVPSVMKRSDVGAPATCATVAVLPILSHRRQRCRQVNVCSKETCPAFFSADERCWLVPDTLCRSPQCVAGGEKIYGCLHCTAFPVLGILIAGKKDEVTKSSLHSLEILASQMTSAVENQRFIESKKEDISNLVKLHDISVGSLQSPGTSLPESIVLSATQFSGIDAAMLWLNGNDGNIYFQEASQVDISLVPKALSVADTFIGKAVAEQRPVETTEMSRVPCLNGMISHHGFLYAASIPLKFKETIFGCLALFKKKDFRMSDSEKAIVLLFAGQSAAAMNTTGLFASLKEEKEFSDAIFSCAASGILVLDRTGNVLKINGAGAEILQIAVEEAVGRRITDLLPGSGEFLAIDAGFGREVFITLPDGSSIPVGFNNSPLLNASEGMDGIIVLFRNMTEIRRLQAELKKKAHFETMSKVISGVAHEIRNPLFGISSIGQILDRELDSQQHRTLIQAMLKETDRMKRLIDELLLYTRPSRLDRRKVDVAIVIEELKQYTMARRDGIEFSAVVEPLLTVNADRDKFIQVLLNLLNNAIDAAKSTISVTARTWKGKAVITVFDDGAGIKEKDMLRIFDPFFTTKKGGTGLGLPICRKIVEDHGGEIDVKSSEEAGTAVTIFLPAG